MKRLTKIKLNQDCNLNYWTENSFEKCLNFMCSVMMLVHIGKHERWNDNNNNNRNRENYYDNDNNLLLTKTLIIVIQSNLKIPLSIYSKKERRDDWRLFHFIFFPLSFHVYNAFQSLPLSLYINNNSVSHLNINSLFMMIMVREKIES